MSVENVIPSDKYICLVFEYCMSQNTARVEIINSYITCIDINVPTPVTGRDVRRTPAE